MIPATQGLIVYLILTNVETQQQIVVMGDAKICQELINAFVNLVIVDITVE